MEKVYAIVKLLLVALIIISTVASLNLNAEKVKAYNVWLTITMVTNFVSLILFVFDAVVTIIT